MMLYQKNNLNFIPKDTTETKTEDIKSESKENRQVNNDIDLTEENRKLIQENEALKRRINEVEGLLFKKDAQIESIVREYNEYLQYQQNPKEFKEIQSKINEIASLSEENEVLKNQVKSQKDHIQLLYLLLLIMAII